MISFVSDTVDVLAERLSSMADLADEHPEILGSHLEGSSLAPGRRGAHSAARLCDPTPAAVRHLLAAARGTLRQVTLDPQGAGAAEACALFRDAGERVPAVHLRKHLEEGRRRAIGSWQAEVEHLQAQLVAGGNGP